MSKDFSQDREFKVILEDIHSQFRVFGEGLQTVNTRLDRVDHHVSSGLQAVNTRLDRVEHHVSSGLQAVNTRLDRLEQHVGSMDSFLKKVLPTIATKDDLKKFEGRLSALESTR